MKNFGFTELVLVAPQRPLNKRAYALASHATDVLDQARQVNSVLEAVQDCSTVLGTTSRKRAAESRLCVTVREAVRRYPAANTAILFGREDYGLSNEDLDHCHAYITIPTSDYASLNLAQAVNVVAYEWFHQEAQEPVLEAALATRAELEAFYQHMMDVAHKISYVQGNKESSARRFLTSIFDRAHLSSKEVEGLRGLWRQMDWAIRQPPERFEVEAVTKVSDQESV
jgi:tRNA/rRNA methyltransferase